MSRRTPRSRRTGCTQRVGEVVGQPPAEHAEGQRQPARGGKPHRLVERAQQPGMRGQAEERHERLAAGTSRTRRSW